MSKADLQVNPCNEKKRIESFLRNVNESFGVALNERVDLVEYSEKLYKRAVNHFISVNAKDIGHVAFYLNYDERECFVSTIAVLPDHSGQGYGTRLMNLVIETARDHDMARVALEADRNAPHLLCFYRKFGFVERNRSTYRSVQLVMPL